jgi:hypothetical protein
MSRARLLLGLAVLLLVVAVVLIGFSTLFNGSVRATHLAGPCPPGAPGIGKPIQSPDDITTYLKTHPLWGNINPAATIDVGTVQYQFTTLETVTGKYLSAGDTGCPPDTKVVYVEFLAVQVNATPSSSSSSERYSFEFAGPPGLSASYPVGYEVFFQATGNLLSAGGKPARQPGLTPAPTPTPASNTHMQYPIT